MSAIVIGGGLGGLLTARGLRARGFDVTVVEASDRLGGQIHTTEFCGLPVDVGAEAMFLGAPALRELVTELGLLDEVVGPRSGTSWLHAGRKLTKLPEGVGPTGPTKLAPVVSSGLLNPAELARAGMEPAMARKITEDIPVGDFLSGRFGRAVAEKFLDPVLGNLHAGDVFQLSLHATAPQLRPTAEQGTSILKSPRRAPSAGGAPLFASFPRGMDRLTEALVADLRAKGVEIFCDTRVTSLTREQNRWVVNATSGYQAADHVILTAGASNIDLIAPHFPRAAEPLAATELASVATVILAYPREAIGPQVLDANGVLLTSRSGRLLKAATFLSRKWEHLDNSDVFCIRASVGRAGSDVLEVIEDEQIASRVHRDLTEVMDITARPIATRVTRWPHTYPQLRVGHLDRVAAARSALAGTGLFVGASAVDGLGLPSVVRSADALAAAVM